MRGLPDTKAPVSTFTAGAGASFVAFELEGVGLDALVDVDPIAGNVRQAGVILAYAVGA